MDGTKEQQKDFRNPILKKSTDYLRYNLYKKTKNYYDGLELNKSSKHYAYDLSSFVFGEGECVDKEAINNSIVNIILTLSGEYLFEPSIGSRLLLYMFDGMTLGVGETILDSLIESIKNTETRIIILEKECTMEIFPDINTLDIKIVYVIKESGEVSSFEKRISI